MEGAVGLRGALAGARALAVRATGPMTPFGRSIAVLGVAAWVLGAVLGWDELMVIAGACLIGLLIAALFTLGRMTLDVKTELKPMRVVAGGKAVADFQVRNSSTRRMLPVRLEVPIGRAIASISVPSLGADGEFEETIVIPTARRSVVGIGPTRSVRGDALGLMRREVVWTDLSELFVHPATNRLTGLTSGWMRDLEGQPTNDRSPSDVAFHTLREYVPGDDRRHVHWKTSARIGKLMVRQFIDNRRSHLALVVSTMPSDYADADEFELAVSMAASLGLRAITEGQEASCVAGDHGISAHTGQALLDGLARVELGAPAISMHELAMRAAPAVQAASVIALFTGSAVPMHEIQLAAQRFGIDTSLLVLRAATGSRATMARVGNMRTVSVGTLDEFGRAMVTVSEQ